MHTTRSLLALLFSATAALTLTGCGISADTASDGSFPLSTGTINGTTYGGRQPIVGAQIYLLQANTTANAGPGIVASSANKSTNLLSSGDGSDTDGEYVLTDSTGKFTVNGHSTACTAGDQVYLYSKGGKPDGVTANAGAGLVAILGTCGSSFSSSTTVNMNEISTIAAAYAMAGFASDATHVGSVNSTNALTGIKNAFANANQLYDITTSAYTGHPSAPRSTTPGGATVPVQQIETLADILANCVNSSSACTTLFANDPNLITPTAGHPTDTATAAIYMAQNQHNTSVYNVAPSPPYTTYYNTVPNDLSIQLSFTGGGLTAFFGVDYPLLAIDASGNVWAAGAGTKLSEFSPLGVPVNAAGFSIPVSTNSVVNVAVDNASSPNVWVTDAADNYLVKFNIANSTSSNVAVPSGGSPDGIAFNSSGNLWVSDYNLNEIYAINATTNAIGTTTADSAMGNPGPPAIADNGYIWVSSANPAAPGGINYALAVFNSSGTLVNNSSALNQAVNVAVDSSNNAWFLHYENHNVVKASTNGSTISTTNYNFPDPGQPSTFISPEDLAIDGNGNVWIAAHAYQPGTNPAQYLENEIIELNNAGTVMSGSTGFIPTTTSSAPEDVAIDGSGNVWYLSSNDATLHEMIGAGAPTDVPLAHAVAHNLVGARP